MKWVEFNQTLNVCLSKSFHKTNFNCWTLVVELYKSQDIFLKDFTPVEWDIFWPTKCEGPGMFQKGRTPEWIQVSVPRALDLVAFQNKKGTVYHVGVMIDGRRFVHCTLSTNCIISSISDWREKVNGFYRYDKSKVGQEPVQSAV